MVRIGADDVAVTREDIADVDKDDHPAGEAVVITDVHGERRSGAGEDWYRFEAEITAMDAEVVDDPVRLYMREIGRVELLTAAEERTLAAEIELASHLEELERELALGLGDDCGEDAGADGAPAAAPWEKAMLLLARVARAGPVVRAVARHLELGHAPTLEDVCEHLRFRAAIDGVISPELVKRVASELDMTEEDARERIVRLSRDTRALPRAVITVVVSHVPVWTELHPDNSEDSDRCTLAMLSRMLGDPELSRRVEAADDEMAPALRGGRGGGEAGSRPSGGGQPAAGGQRGGKVPEPRGGVSGPGPGGEPGADPRSGEVRPPAGLQVQHLRHLVDPAGGDPGRGQPGPDDTGTGAPGGDHQPAGAAGTGHGAGAGTGRQR